MQPFTHRNGILHAESVALPAIARRFGTPCFVYSRAAIESSYRAFEQALRGRDALICYSVKANSNLAVLGLLARIGAGFDIVSGGELARVLAAGGEARKVLFSGVGKTAAEITAALQAGIRCFNLESEEELERVASIAGRLRKRAPIAFRVNPDIDARTHPYISTGLRSSKFGVPYREAARLFRVASRLRQVEVVGIGCHIGSQMVDPAPLAAAVGRIVALIEKLARLGIRLGHIDIGGGMGIRYRNERTIPLDRFLAPCLAALGARGETLILDPGRSLVGNAGLLLTRIEYVKVSGRKRFLVVDAAMNDLVRPALYEAWHEVVAVRKKRGRALVYDIVGPICESADFLARERKLSAAAGDLLAICSAGAYGMVLSSNYNSRPRAPEILVHRSKAQMVRRRERVEDLYSGESVPAW
ncbi:MAG TPA: diaminopimelate decarboxylase [Burkholderiales bacterium]|nr:diaminopimelate decarboxylase [Burkholderiales bacterium]